MLLFTLWSDTLGGPAWAWSQLSQLIGGVVGSAVLSLWDGGHEVTRGRGRLVRVEDWVGYGPDGGHPLHVLVGEVSLPLLFPLSQRHVQRLGGHDTAVHLRHGLGGLLRRGEAHKAEPLAATALHHHLEREDYEPQKKMTWGCRHTETGATSEPPPRL